MPDQTAPVSGREPLEPGASMTIDRSEAQTFTEARSPLYESPDRRDHSSEFSPPLDDERDYDTLEEASSSSSKLQGIAKGIQAAIERQLR